MRLDHLLKNLISSGRSTVNAFAYHHHSRSGTSVRASHTKLIPRFERDEHVSAITWNLLTFVRGPELSDTTLPLRGMSLQQTTVLSHGIIRDSGRAYTW